MDRYLLRYFLAVAELGSFSKAAARVSVTQPTLSVGIAKLEEQLGARLFERTTRRVSLTPAGSRFLTHARRITQEYEAALREVSETPQLKRVRAGVLSTIPARDLERVMALHARNTGGEALEILDSTERDIANRLSDGRLDVAITILRPGLESFAQEKLRNEPYVLFVSANHKLSGVESVEGGELAGETMIVRRQCEGLPEISRYFTNRDVRPSFSLRTLNDDRAMSMVAARLGVTVAPASFLRSGLAAVKLAGFTLNRDVGLVFSDRMRERSGAFVEAVRATYGDRRKVR
ncbi:LysR family transcriptional regulator [Terricaulis silvestris]|uniref:Morphology and auto-aggregation control protein n=1 Tax=Terricaulis silvestris TaxID=2686094 RepID=A0A6I6MQL7_9CAUL|nr:LysR family transcriptional regulator [Terricaulis silvestris]QGZ93473.1 Morphology and auto-aggregation control protein [Terricaulis silvestris]